MQSAQGLSSGRNDIEMSFQMNTAIYASYIYQLYMPAIPIPGMPAIYASYICQLYVPAICASYMCQLYVPAICASYLCQLYVPARYAS